MGINPVMKISHSLQDARMRPRTRMGICTQKDDKLPISGQAYYGAAEE